MKKIISLFCGLALVFSLFSVSTFAASADTSSEVAAMTADSPTGTRATSLGLWYEEDKTVYAGDVKTMTVQPEDGANLRIWLKHWNGPVRVAVAYTNWAGFWVEIYDDVFDPGERDLLLVDDCNGKRYQVKITATELYANYSVLLYQN